MNNSPKIVIVGGNAAGPAAAAKAKRTNPNAQVTLFETGEFISTGTCELPYVLSGKLNDYKDIIFFTPESFFQKKGVEVHTSHLVESIDRREKLLQVRNLKSNSGYQFQYDKLILTTGSNSRIIPQLTSQLENVFTLKSVKDYLRIKKYIESYPSQNILIIGAGYIGLEVAEAFKKLGKSVTIFEKSHLPMPGIEIEVRHLIKEILDENKVEFNGNVEDLKFKSDGTRIEYILHEGRALEFDIILNATGVEPNNSLAVSSRLQLGNFGGLKVDQQLKTSDSNIFAAGDNIEVINRITKKPGYFPVATLAHAYGHIAGANAAGSNIRVEPYINNIAVKVFDKIFVSVGLNSESASENHFNVSSVHAVASNLIKVMPGSEKIFGKIIYDKYSHLILGALFLGGKEVTGYGDLIASMIYNQSKIEGLARFNYNYTPPASPFVNLLSILGRNIDKEKR